MLGVEFNLKVGTCMFMETFYNNARPTGFPRELAVCYFNFCFPNSCM